MIDLTPAADRLIAVIDVVAATDLDRATPCSEYCVGDLLDHIAGVTIAFGGAAVKAKGASSSMGPSGDGSNLAEDWQTSLPLKVTGLAAAWSDREAWSGITRVGGIELPGEVAGIIALGELIVHGWDLAGGDGIQFEPDPRSLSPLFEVVQTTFGSGNDESRGTAFGPAVPVAADAPLFDQILGLLGRDPAWSETSAHETEGPV